MSEPTVTFDFEFGFHRGEPQFFSAMEGRDTIAADEARVRLEIHPDEHTVEEITVNRSALSYMRTTKRTHVEEAKAEAVIKLVEGNG